VQRKRYVKVNLIVPRYFLKIRFCFDIVFVARGCLFNWKEYYNPVTNHLARKRCQTGIWDEAKAQLETNTPIEVNPDSIYKPIERPVRKFNTLRIPGS
jgi:ribosome biogenesis protein BMS1